MLITRENIKINTYVEEHFTRRIFPEHLWKLLKFGRLTFTGIYIKETFRGNRYFHINRMVTSYHFGGNSKKEYLPDNNDNWMRCEFRLKSYFNHLQFAKDNHLIAEEENIRPNFSLVFECCNDSWINLEIDINYD